MTRPSERTVSVFEIFDSVMRHLKLGLLAFLFVFGLAVVAWLFLPREYGSEGRLVVRMGRANLGMNTAPDGARMVSIQDTRETEIRSVVDLIKSQQVLGDVVDEIGAEEILKNTIQIPMPGFGGDEPEDESGINYSEARKREKAIKRLSGELKVETEKKSANVSVYCTGAEPLLAQKIVNLVMARAQETHVRVHSVNRSKSHFDRGLAGKEEQLKKHQTALEEFANENQFLTVDDARATLNGVIDKLENQLVDADLDLRQSLAMVKELESQFSGIRAELMMPREGIERAATAGAQGQLYQRIGEKARLMARYNENHPRLTQINAEIKRLEEEVGALPEERTQHDKVQNPIYENLKVELVKEIARAESMLARQAKAEQTLEHQKEQLSKMNSLKTESYELQRRVQLAQMEFDSYAKKRNEAHMIDQLDKEAISDIVIQQPATLWLKKVSPKGSLLLPMGVFFGTLCGLAVCIFADRKTLTNLSTPEEIEEAIGIPVISTIPRVHSSRVLIN